MPYDVFISHSSKDKLTADAVCNRLESAGIRCWIAPRDIIPGEGWSAAIMRGIDTSKVMVLVFSENANVSAHVRREVAHACDHEITVIPMRIRDVTPKEGLKYYLDELHWLDALTPPLASHLETLTTRVKNILTGEQNAEAGTRLDKGVAPSSPSKRTLVSPLRLGIVFGALALLIVA
ncbi:MAG: toll/interleukin-1 receptor domain-containing protein, partial [Verrucomicrobia bacterium]|nr:toll/interleukin-1 receptor domain-containing protein [Verrucomicrobiota bacterium]